MVEGIVGVRGSIELTVSLGHRPGATTAVDREGGPSVAVLITDVHEQGVVVVLDARAVRGVPLLAQRPRPSTGGDHGGDE